jgi:hypothetical protein
LRYLAQEFQSEVKVCVAAPAGSCIGHGNFSPSDVLQYKLARHFREFNRAEDSPLSIALKFSTHLNVQSISIELKSGGKPTFLTARLPG